MRHFGYSSDIEGKEFDTPNGRAYFDPNGEMQYIPQEEPEKKTLIVPINAGGDYDEKGDYEVELTGEYKRNYKSNCYEFSVKKIVPGITTWTILVSDEDSRKLINYFRS